MNCTQVRVSEETNEVRFAAFLQSQYCRTLKSYVGLEILSNLAYETLKREPTNEQVGTFLVAANLTEGDGARAVPVRFFDASRCRRRLSGRFGGQLLAWGLPARTLAGSLLRARHGVVQVVCMQEKKNYLGFLYIRIVLQIGFQGCQTIPVFPPLLHYPMYCRRTSKCQFKPTPLAGFP